MQYISTRGEDQSLGYSDIVLKGLATDAGLYLPRTYPKVRPEDLERWRALPYHELAFEILRLFATDMDPQVLRELLEQTYRSEVFSLGRSDSDANEIAPTRAIGNNGLHLLELSNGPTLAFKDMAMQYLGALFEYLLAQNGQQLNILGATSGDTGSAAEYAMRGRRGIRVFMLSPNGRMSAFQRAQMYSLADDNIHNIAVEGTFDDAQDIVKACSRDQVFKQSYHIGTVNSINWARISAQVVYYFKGYLSITEGHDEIVDVAVPSGNFGNILAGWIAKQMGLPLGNLVVATNENDVLHEFFQTGKYRVRDSEHTFVTSSPSMDISKASNFERFIFDITGRNPDRVRQLWTEVALNGGFTLTAGEKMAVEASGFKSSRSTHQDRLAKIAHLWREHQLLVDPHTADGLVAAERLQRFGVKMLVLETALPAKFADTIQEAVGIEPPIPEAYEQLFEQPQHVTVMPAKTEDVQAYIKKAIDGIS